jgi:hypothetical protein
MQIIVQIMITFQIYMKVRWHRLRLGGNSKKQIFITNVLFNVQSIDNYIYCISIILFFEKRKAYKKAMEDLHKVNVHEFNNGII